VLALREKKGAIEPGIVTDSRAGASVDLRDELRGRLK